MKTHLRLIHILLIGCCIAQVTGFLLCWTGWLPAASIAHFYPSGMDSATARALGDHQRMLGMLAGLPALAALLYGMWRLHRLLRALHEATPFAASSIAHLRSFAASVLAATLLTILEPGARTLLYRYVLGLPEHVLSIGVDSSEVMLILVCALFYMVTGALNEGRRLAEENEAFV